MPSTDPFEPSRDPRASERGNIALVAALLVMALGGVGIGMARLVQLRIEASTETRLANYAATLAQNVAESGVNQVLYNWNTGTAPAPSAAQSAPGNYAGIGTLVQFPSLSTTYPGIAAPVTSACAYTVAVADSGANWTLTVVGTVTANGTYLPSQAWRTISRQVVATVPKNGGVPPFSVSVFSR